MKCIPDSFSVSPIGYVFSPYKQKFGLPRQSGLIPNAVIEIHLQPVFHADCVRGLQSFDYVWVQFIFHAALDEGWLPLIRPPKLGGRKKVGVFATRSPHRPNHLGLSLLKLEDIRIDAQQQVILVLSGADLLDQTPVIDIKPYLAYVEAKPEAISGFAQARPLLEVHWQAVALQDFRNWGLSADFKLLIDESLAQDPRPAHQHGKHKTYVMQLEDIDVLFEVKDKVVWVLSLRNRAL